MFERLSNGWQLAKQSFHVLRMDKELLVFPLLSGVACLLVLASFAVPLWATGFAEAVADDRNPQANVLGWIVLFAFYLVNYFVIVFFNSALVACAVIRFNGEDPTIKDGLGAAMARLPQIFGWALVAASVGVILRAIESRSEKVGSIVAGILGMGWSIVTFFVVPVIVIEKANPLQAVKRSTAILKKTWGESLSANFGVSTIAFLFTLPAILLIVGGAMLIGVAGPIAGGAVIGVGVLWVLVVSLVSSALSAIVLAALYMYAATDRVPEVFDASLLTNAFGHK
ncbi:MAG: DUF6159 family protein [Pirellulales bacterium]